MEGNDQEEADFGSVMKTLCHHPKIEGQLLRVSEGLTREDIQAEAGRSREGALEGVRHTVGSSIRRRVGPFHPGPPMPCPAAQRMLEGLSGWLLSLAAAIQQVPGNTMFPDSTPTSHACPRIMKHWGTMRGGVGLRVFWFLASVQTLMYRLAKVSLKDTTQR